MRKIKGSWLNRYIEMGEKTESPIIFHKWIGLLLLASSLRLNVYLDHPNFMLYPNMYVILVSPPGISRKSTAGSFGIYTVADNVDNIKKFSGRITTEALCEKLSNFNQITHKDGHDILCNDASLLLYSSELSTLLSQQPKGSYSLLKFLLDVYEERQFNYSTKKTGDQGLRNLCINLLGATTPSGVANIINYDGVENGFTSRVLFIYQNNKIIKPWPEEIDIHAQSKKNNLIHDLNYISTFSGEVSFNSKCKDWYNKWRQRDSQEVLPPELKEYQSRRTTILLKVAILLMVSEKDNTTMHIKYLNKAEKILREVEYYMPYAYTNFGKTKDSYIRDEIFMFIESKYSVTRSEIINKFHRKLGKNNASLDEQLKILIASGKVSTAKGAKNNGVRYSINN